MKGRGKWRDAVHKPSMCESPDYFRCIKLYVFLMKVCLWMGDTIFFSFHSGLLQNKHLPAGKNQNDFFNLTEVCFLVSYPELTERNFLPSILKKFISIVSGRNHYRINYSWKTKEWLWCLSPHVCICIYTSAIHESGLKKE